jgi:putative membrane protein
MRRIDARLLAIAPLILAGCASGERRAAPAPLPAKVSSAIPREIAPQSAVTAAAYVASASSIELFEIMSSELALKRARTRRVREFAQMVLEAHMGASMQLSLAGRRLDLLPVATLSPPHQAMFDRLQQAADFDALYRRQQLAVHRDAVRVHGNYASLGASPTLRPVAAAMLPVFQRYLRLLRYL